MRIYKIFLFFIIFTNLIFGQEKATITGVVKDAKTNDPLPGVSVMIKGTYYGAATNIKGEYTIKEVNPGSYTIEFSLIGYKQVQVTGYVVKAGDKKVLNIKLEDTYLTLDKDIVIIGEKPLMNVEETSSKKTVSKDEIEVSAVKNITDLVSQQSGVVMSDNTLHIRGGRSYENAFLLDGVSVQDPLAGTGFGLQLSASSIEEVEVITGGFNAEYGQATSGVVNVRTREGGDNYRGGFSWKRDNLGFNKDSYHNFNTDQVEASLSGPEPLTSFILPALGVNFPGSLTVFANFSMALSDGLTMGYVRTRAKQVYSSIFHGSRFAPRTENNWFWLGKLTWKVSPKIKLSYSYNQSVSINQNSQSLQSNLEYYEPSPGNQFKFQYNLDNANTYTHNNIYNILNYTHTFTAKTMLELKISQFYSKFRADANGKYWTEYQEPKDIPRFPVEYFYTSGDTIGVIPGDGFWDYGNPDTWHDHYMIEYSIRGDLTSHFDEKNKFKTGFDINFREMQYIDIYKPYLGTMGLNNDIYRVYPTLASFYAQDNINFSGMILNFGLRVDAWAPGKYVDEAIDNPDVITIPQQIRDSYKSHTISLFGRRWKARLSPRLGISHPISDNQTLFFSYGHFNKWPKPQYIYAKLNPQSAKSSFQKFGNPNLDPETTVAYEIGIRNQFTENDVLTVTAYYKDIFDYVTTRSTKIQDIRLGNRTFITYVNLDYARSRGIEVEYKKRFGRLLSAALNASYSITTGKSSSADDGVLVLKGEIDEPIKEEYMAWDRPIQASLNLNFFVEKGKPLFDFLPGILDNYNLFLRFFYQSGKRYTPFYFTGKYQADGRPEYVIDRTRRYGEIGENWFYVNMNFEKYFNIGNLRMALLVEVTNLLDNLNAAIINPATGRAYEYGDPTPITWNDPLYPSYQAPLDPYPFNPARYLAKRNVKVGISIKF